MLIPLQVKNLIDLCLICGGIYLNKRTLDEDLPPFYPCAGGILMATGTCRFIYRYLY